MNNEAIPDPKLKNDLIEEVGPLLRVTLKPKQIRLTNRIISTAAEDDTPKACVTLGSTKMDVLDPIPKRARSGPTL